MDFGKRLVSLIEGHGNRTFLIAGGTRFTFLEAASMIRGAVRYYLEVGIRPKTRIAVISHPSPEYICSLLALLDLETQVLPLHSREPTSVIPGIVNEANCHGLIYSRDFHHLPEFYSPAYSMIQSVHIEPTLTGDDKIPVSGNLGSPATILRTSGTGGAPKFAVLSLHNHLFNALGANAVVSFRSGDVWLLSIPLYHVGGQGILFRAILGGGAVRVMDRSESLTTAIQSRSVTHLSLVTTQLRRLLVEPETVARLSQMKAVLVGGSPVPVELRERCSAHGITLQVTYGLTEMASQVTTTPPGVRSVVAADAGVLLPYRKLRIADDGEIEVGGETLFLGYLEEGKLREPPNRGGYFPTGDLGETRNGHLFVRGRKDNLIISGGENIQPEEIEEVLLRYRKIMQAVVVPVPHDDFGHRPVAFVEMESETSSNLRGLPHFLLARLPRYKIPDRIYRWPKDLTLGFQLKPDRLSFQDLAVTPEVEKTLLITLSEP